MKRIASFLLAFAGAQLACAEPVWIKVSQNEFESIYYDRTTVELYGPIVIVDEVRNRHNPSPAFPTVSFIAKVEYDCLIGDIEIVRIISTSEHFGKGTVLRDSADNSRWRGSTSSSDQLSKTEASSMEVICKHSKY
jgi:hypothetical protein